MNTDPWQVLADGIRSTEVTGAPPSLDERTIFVGSGDSLSSAMSAERYGHRALSAGDLAWDGVPSWCRTVVGVSVSGGTGGTVLAVRAAAEAGLRTLAITANVDSPLAAAADSVLTVTVPKLQESVPAVGYTALAQGVLLACGGQSVNSGAIADRVIRLQSAVSAATHALPTTLPAAVSILTLPDMRAAGDFWSLKLIEATGVSVRSVPLEESGHVDYFIGPQPHLVIALVGDGVARHERLAAALSANGHTVITIALDGYQSTVDEIALAATGSIFSAAAAAVWQRPLFRAGQVDMAGEHIALQL